MSIPGLGQLPIKAATTSARKINLRPFWEWRFQIPHNNTVAVRLVSGTAERDGTELALNVTYKFRGIKSKILTWRGCELDIEPSGEFDEYLAEYAGPDETPEVSYLNLHFLLDGLRKEARARSATGPRVLIAGAPSVGKTSLARTLAALAVKSGAQPVVANMDPHEGMLSLPGTLTAAVYATIMDLDGEGTNGWGGTPTSGPSGVPVKLPIAQYYGRQDATDDIQLYKELVSKLAGAATARMSGDGDVKSSGMIIDTPGIEFSGQIEPGTLDALTHVIDEFSVNIVVVLGSPKIHTELQKRFAREKTTLGEPIASVLLDQSHGVVERDEGWMKLMQEAAIKEYFFGDSKRTLSPFSQQVDFDSVAIYRIPEPNEHGSEGRGLEKIEPTPALSHWTLAVMNASVGDSPESIRTASVLGFVYISDVVKDRRKLSMLTPVSGRLGQRPLLWGNWPEQYINLLG
ncbi:hypothetical protein KVR01_003573 [Diaporthe batatas]|uniref:cleavage polyadenylation factor subunit CLP1 n=1 Tax=Diaporthe batatas TaxID=748121 RepID=UPI001D04D496|nr:cleavage polyadenylation factor subunit CLP1 [Diaporthe batatas]KAG8167884.1 hypothetical protein KVR01_003573 [Diaporthe batatas]